VAALAALTLAAGPARADLPFTADYSLMSLPRVPLGGAEYEVEAVATDATAPFGLTSATADNLFLFTSQTTYLVLPASTFDFTDTDGNAVFGTLAGSGGLTSATTQVVNATFAVTGGTGLYAGYTGGGTFTINADEHGAGTLAVAGSLVPSVPEAPVGALLALGLLPVGLLVRARRRHSAD
jgi:hypothetical protein